MQQLAKELRLERIEFCGPMYGADKWKAYREADLFVLPTHSENFGMAVAESLAAGTPVIVTRGAPWKGVETHRAGWWIDIGVEPLRLCLEEALAVPPRSLHEMGMRGRTWMSASYAWTAVGRQMKQTYQWLITGRDRPACIVDA